MFDRSLYKVKVIVDPWKMVYKKGRILIIGSTRGMDNNLKGNYEQRDMCASANIPSQTHSLCISILRIYE